MDSGSSTISLTTCTCVTNWRGKRLRKLGSRVKAPDLLCINATSNSFGNQGNSPTCTKEIARQDCEESNRGHSAVNQASVVVTSEKTPMDSPGAGSA